MRKGSILLLFMSIVAHSLYGAAGMTVEEAQRAESLKEHNELIEMTHDSWYKQWLICDREFIFFAATGDPQKCIKAAEMSFALKGKKLTPHQEYGLKGGDEKAINKHAGMVLLNAGVIYSEQRDYDNSIKMYEKAASLGNEEAVFNIAVSYYWGRGVQKNHAKAYEYGKKALSLGVGRANNFISGVCSESPWACR